MGEIEQLMETLGHTFKDMALLERALTHRSIPGDNNERLEFLGDAVLSCIIAAELFQRHPGSREGDLSRMRSILVNGDMLGELAKDLDIGPHLHLGVGEAKTGGHQRKSILADALEAIIGAIYLDSGIDEARRCVLGWFGGRFDDLSGIAPDKDPKSTLQEWLQAHKYPLPQYDAEITGAAHAQTFYVTCQVEGLLHKSHGKSTSRRKAEQLAAQHYLELLNEK